MSIPQHSPPDHSGSALQPLVLRGAILRESHSSGKALQGKLSCFDETHGADHVFLSGLMLSGEH